MYRQSLGLIATPNAYLKSPWNRLDGFIVTASLLSGSNPAFRTLRVLRVLRPLRLISKVEGLKVTVSLLLKVAPRVVDVLLVYVLFLDVFAILGVQFFAGRFGQCVEDTSFTTLAACEAAGYAWLNPTAGHFDSTPSATLLLFEMSLLEGWLDVLWSGIDATSIGHAPVQDTNRAQALFFVLWVMIGAVFLLNLFVGVLVSTFADIKKEEEFGGDIASIGVSEHQKEWLELMVQLLSIRPKRRQDCPPNACRACCFKLVKHKNFDVYILLAILFNTLLMALDGYGISAQQKHLLDGMNNACTLVFVVECLGKLAAFGCKGYFSEAWNVFDFSVVTISVLVRRVHTHAALLSAPRMLCLVSSRSPYAPTCSGTGARLQDLAISILAAGLETNPTLMRILRMLRVTRILRTFRVIKSARSLRMLLSMLVLSLPALGNIIGLFLIITSMFSLLAMQLFGRVANGEHINEDANFWYSRHAIISIRMLVCPSPARSAFLLLLPEQTRSGGCLASAFVS